MAKWEKGKRKRGEREREEEGKGKGKGRDKGLGLGFLQTPRNPSSNPNPNLAKRGDVTVKLHCFFLIKGVGTFRCLRLSGIIDTSSSSLLFVHSIGTFSEVHDVRVMMLTRRSWIKMSHKGGFILLPGCGALSFSTDAFLNSMSMVLGNIIAHPSASGGQASSSSSSHSHSPFSHSPLSPFSHVRSYSASLEGSSSPSGGGGNGGASSSSDVSSEVEEDS